jgi:hypothetical protein
MNLHQLGTFRRNEREERARIGTLLSELQRSLETIRADLEVEEKRAQWPSPEDPSYPIAARSLRDRRDNIAATIRFLESARKR